jgi:hypothetical protein
VNSDSHGKFVNSHTLKLLRKSTELIRHCQLRARTQNIKQRPIQNAKVKIKKRSGESHHLTISLSYHLIISYLSIQNAKLEIKKVLVYLTISSSPNLHIPSSRTILDSSISPLMLPHLHLASLSTSSDIM